MSEEPKRRGRPPARKRRRTLEDDFDVGKTNLVGDPDPNYYYHVVSDKPGRIKRLEDRGYEVVESDSGLTLGDYGDKAPGTRVEATADPSIGRKAVLMRCPREFKDEDDAFRAKQIDKTEEAIYRDEAKEEGRYGSVKRDTPK